MKDYKAAGLFNLVCKNYISNLKLNDSRVIF